MQKSPLFAVVLFVLLGSSLYSQSFKAASFYPIETSHSYINFVTTYMGYAKVRGSFGNFYGTIYFDPDDWSQTSVSFQIDVESIDTNNDWRDKDLKSGNWFLAEEFPHIRFISTAVRPEGEQLIVSGKLTIKETTKEISFPIHPPQGVIHDIRGDDQIIFTGAYTLNRKEYGVMGKNWSQVKEGIAALADEVTIEFSLLGKRINADNFKNWFRNVKTPHGSLLVAYQDNGLEGVISNFEQMKEAGEVNSNALNMTAYMLMKRGQDEDALALLLRNQQEFPEDQNGYDSLGEIYLKMQQYEKAKENYQKALELNPDNMNAVEVLKHL